MRLRWSRTDGFEFSGKIEEWSLNWAAPIIFLCIGAGLNYYLHDIVAAVPLYALGCGLGVIRLYTDAKIARRK